MALPSFCMGHVLTETPSGLDSSTIRLAVLVAGPRILWNASETCVPGNSTALHFEIRLQTYDAWACGLFCLWELRDPAGTNQKSITSRFRLGAEMTSPWMSQATPSA